jgi:hypothetical protein
MLATAFLAVQRAAIPEPGPQEPKPGPEHAPTPGNDQITKESEAAG